MDKESPLRCEGCKMNNEPILCYSKKHSHTETCQIKKGSPGTCYKEKKKIEVDLTRCLRSRRKSQDLDDKIKNLKDELTSLVGEASKLKAGINNFSDFRSKKVLSNSTTKHENQSYEGYVSFSGVKVDVNPQQGNETQSNSTEEFTQWLDLTIDSLNGAIDSDGDKNKDISDTKDVIVDKVIEGDPDCIITKEYVTPDVIAEELLYESFVVQNHPSYMLGASGNGEELVAQPMNLSKRKYEKTDEGRHRSAKKTRTTDKKHSFKKQWKDKTIQPRSDKEVEIINIDDDSDNSSPMNNQFDCHKERQEVIVIRESETVPKKRASHKERSRPKNGIWECPICFEQSTGQAIVTTMCGHVFCKKCLEEYHVAFGKSCPTCRTVLYDQPLITLFNF